MNPQDCDMQQDEMQAHSLFGKVCYRRSNLQGEEADSWDKREYCKTAEAFLFMTKSKMWVSLLCAVVFSLRESSLMIQANLKLSWHLKGNLTLTQHMVLPSLCINTTIYAATQWESDLSDPAES